MKKKIILASILIMLITSGLSYSVVGLSNNKNFQVNDEKDIVPIGEPLTVKAEVKEISSSIILLSANATNTWNEPITVHWSSKPCLFEVLYPLPNEENIILLVYYPYNRNIFQYFDTEIEFEPGEEKLIQKAVFFGISNWILPGLVRGYKEYLPSFPMLPDGDYIFNVFLNAYTLSPGEWYPTYLFDTVNFRFGTS